VLGESWRCAFLDAPGRALAGRGDSVPDGVLVRYSASDPVSIALAVAALALVSTIACYVPARRATRVDPPITLRSTVAVGAPCLGDISVAEVGEALRPRLTSSRIARTSSDAPVHAQ
jgi:hypothetical protein